MDNYPPGAANDPNAPYNEVEIPEKDFEVTCCQTLSRTALVTTNNYAPGASGVDYEDGIAFGWQDLDDTSNTNWDEEYSANDYKTPLELIGMLQAYLERDLRELQKDMLPNDRSFKATQARMLKGLIEECECWTDDETEITL